MTIERSSVLLPAPDACVESLGAETVVWLPGPRTLHLLDAAGTAIWCRLDGRTVGDVVGSLIDAYPDAASTVERDVAAFLARVLEQGLVHPVVSGRSVEKTSSRLRRSAATPHS